MTMGEIKAKQPLQWVQTALLTIILGGGGALLKELQSDVKSNASTLIRVEERQNGVLAILPNLQHQDDQQKLELERHDRLILNHEYRIDNLEKKTNTKP